MEATPGNVWKPQPRMSPLLPDRPARYLISFDDGAMDFIPEKEMPDVADASHAVIRDAQDAGVFVFAGGVYPHDEVSLSVVTLQDRPRLLAVQPISIAQLTRHNRPAPLPPTRLPFERHQFRVSAAVTLVRREPDGDLHLVLWSGADHMIAESPSATCNRGATASGVARCGSRGARFDFVRMLRLPASPSSIFSTGKQVWRRTRSRLHPILGFACLSS